MRGREVRRVFEVIQSDKAVMSDGCKALIEQDLTRKFLEYFDLVGGVNMQVVCNNGVYQVSVAFEAERIKKFNVLK